MLTKQLYIGIYDFSCYYGAWEIKDGQIYERSLEYGDADIIIDLTNPYIKEEEKLVAYKKLSAFIRSYDELIVCDNGYFYYVNLNNYKEEKAK